MPYAPKQYRPSTWKPAARVERRGTDTERGYGWRWAKARKVYVASHPLCEDCLPILEPMHELDHIIPITGPSDPLRFDVDNFRSRCRHHHALKTARYDDEIRGYFERHGKEATLARYREVMQGAT